MRRQRTIYFNDARHFYLFVFEPPMRMEDMWRPVDEVAGTGVDTLVYGVARADGLFYPSKAGKSFRSDVDEIDSTIYWKVRHNILSLEERGVDILQALADRAHERGMEFFVSFRMGTYEGVGSPEADPAEGGRGLADAGARENQLRVFEEIVTQYDLEGIELDFGASPGGMPPVLLDEDVAEYTPVLTEHVRRIAEMTRDAGMQVGMRVPCIEKVCAAQGFDVRTWLKEGLVDYLTPMMYANLHLDPQMPMEWALRGRPRGRCARLRDAPAVRRGRLSRSQLRRALHPGDDARRRVQLPRQGRRRRVRVVPRLAAARGGAEHAHRDGKPRPDGRGE